MVRRFIELGSKISCTWLLIIQGFLLNGYLHKLYSPVWWCWVVADITVVTLWSSLIWIAKKKSIKKGLREQDDLTQKSGRFASHEIKYTFIAWLCYAAFLCPRIILLFHNLAKTLDERDILGPNFLKMAVSFTPLVYFLLVMGSHSNESHDRKGVAVSGALDLFDSIDLLEFLFEPTEGVRCPPGYLHASLGFACISLFLPALTLYGFRHKTSPGRVSSVMFGVSYEMVNLSLINIPNFVIRSVLWHRYSMDVSVLLMKNVMGMVAGSYEIYEYFGKSRPICCKKCDQWFNVHAYHKEHKRTCGDQDGEFVKLTPVFNEPIVNFDC